MNYSIAVPTWARYILSDFSDWDRQPHAVRDVAASGLWHFDLADDAYFEYAFMDEEGKQRPDPLNNNIAQNPWFPAARSLQGKDYQADPYSQLQNVATAPLKRYKLASSTLAQNRRISSYSPLGYEAKALPVIYLQDGPAYYRIGNIHIILEKLLQEKHIRPAHLVFIEPIDRASEYPYNPTYQSFIIEELLPFIETELHTTSERIAMGASLGGLASSLLAWQNPQLFSTLVSQSGAFWGSPEDKNYYLSQDSWFLRQLKATEKRELRLYIETGSMEWLHTINQDIAALCRQKDYVHYFTVRNAGHNWVNWRNGISSALKFSLTK